MPPAMVDAVACLWEGCRCEWRRWFFMYLRSRSNSLLVAVRFQTPSGGLGGLGPRPRVSWPGDGVAVW